MNELPKSVRDELARRQQTSAAHPDANLITAFAEGAATPAERAIMEEHLAACSACREVLFLAAPEQVAQATSAQTVETRSLRWLRPWATWGAVAALLIAGTLVIGHRDTSQELARVTNTEKNQPQTAPSAGAPSEAPPKAEPESAGSSNPGALHTDQAAQRADLGYQSMKKAPPVESKQKDVAAPISRQDLPRETGPTPNRVGDAVAGGVLAKTQPSVTTAEASSVAEVAPVSPSAKLASARNTPKSGPAAPAQNQMAQNNYNQSSSMDVQSAPMAAPSPSTVQTEERNRAFSARAAGNLAAPAQWAITKDGLLERKAAAGAWTPITVGRDTRFTVVASIGSTVWAGGSRGELFNSTDSGGHWSPVTLPGASTSPIRAIVFSDQNHGSIANDDGKRWITADGGLHWQQP